MVWYSHLLKNFPQFVVIHMKDIHSSSPVRTPKLQLAAEQPSTGECLIPPKKDIPRSKAKERPQQDGRKGETTLRIKPLTHQRCSRGLKEILCAPGPRETESELCLSVSCEGTGQQWPATGAGALGAADLGMA